MLNFFRRTRRKLADDNKPMKYARYAIGEIVLVTIGILIALYINNKNEVRKIENKFVSNLLLVHKELEENIVSTTKNINYYLTKNPLIKAVMADTLNIEHYNKEINDYFKTDEGHGLSYILFNTTQVNILNNSFTKLNQNTDKLPNKYYTILRELEKIYSQHRTAVTDWNNKMQTLEKKNIEKFSDNYNWFNKIYYSEQPDVDAFKFFVNNPLYKNYISQYYFLSIEHFEKIKTFRYEAIKTYIAISDLLELKREVDSKSNNFIAGKEVLSCYIGIYTYGNQTCEIILNNSNLVLIWDDKNIEFFPISLTKYITVEEDVTLIFNGTKNCKSNYLIWQQEGQSFKFVKKNNNKG